ncbi:helix-turn-helix domain-containing protein [Methylobacterium sp. E-005]|uniref:helix-turn-helix domain-containing protein n=1 Tax=Methylobacterium sp. E-005 TaxID=2836549 RepID=UPI001FB8AEFF|nr:helix-turn-helix domain-containing protein [Methylobacterium sp. E-005]MCJ2085548.1 helix-turn-helix domain-containing protein [Methylobacterium sp. E-005]
MFHEAGQHIADYIERRRLEMVARRLIDPSCAHIAIRILAYGCGFVSQAHFSRRFEDHFGVTPREFRHRAAWAARCYGSRAGNPETLRMLRT